MSQMVRDLTHISRCGAQYRGDALAELGLKSCHASYLTEICACPGISQDRLARRICINKSNIARQLAVLEEGGFVRRAPSPEDRRVMELYPTEKTIALLPRIQEVLGNWEELLTADLTEEDRQTLARLLSLMGTRAAAWMDERG